MKKINILLIITISLLASCTANTHDIIIYTTLSKCGFWMGLWHGAISPITFIISLFRDNITVWDTNNKGSWYTFGFLLGAGVFTGSSVKASK